MHSKITVTFSNEKTNTTIQAVRAATNLILSTNADTVMLRYSQKIN